MIKKQFPTPYDVEQTITYPQSSYEEFKKFMQRHGIINMGHSKDHIAQFASNILFEHQDYILMRRLAQGGHAVANISGFMIRPTKIPLVIDDFKDDLSTFRTKLNTQAQEATKKGAPTQKLAMPQINNDKLKARFEYQRLRPGRVELLERVDTKIDFTIEPISDTTQWRVLCYPQANQDVKKLEKLFKKMGGKSYEPFIISLEDFPQQQRIQFFDTILEYYSSHDEWQFQEVTEITVKQPSSSDKKYLMIDEEDIESDELTEEEELLQEFSQDDLLSITKAILQGRHLRTNSFVRQWERQGYYFPSMTLLLANRKTSEVIKVTIRFKLKPRMFEVILAEMRQKVHVGDVPAVFSTNRQQEILKEFWNTSHKIWQRIHNEIPKPPGQLSLADYQESRKRSLKKVK